MDTSGLNDYDSLSSLPGVGPGSGLPSTPQVTCAQFALRLRFGIPSHKYYPFQHRNVSNLAIPAGGIDADIGDTLSVQSWGSRGGKSYTSRKSREGSSYTRQEFGSIMRFFHLSLPVSMFYSPPGM